MINEFKEGFDLDKFLAMTSFAEQIRYSNDNLQRLASGSARIIYKIDDKRVLKLAKNKKGWAQNEVEADYVLNEWYGDIIAKVLESDKEDRWIVSEFAKKITKPRFKQLIGVTIDEFYKYLYTNCGQKQYMHYTFSPETKEILDSQSEDEDSFYHQIQDMIGNFDMNIGDFQRISTFGEIESRLVITDYGLTNDVYNKFYKRG